MYSPSNAWITASTSDHGGIVGVSGPVACKRKSSYHGFHCSVTSTTSTPPIRAPYTVPASLLHACPVSGRWAATRVSLGRAFKSSSRCFGGLDSASGVGLLRTPRRVDLPESNAGAASSEQAVSATRRGVRPRRIMVHYRMVPRRTSGSCDVALDDEHDAGGWEMAGSYETAPGG